MARKGRPPSGIARRALEIQLPLELVLQLELYLPRDTLTGKIQHGAWSAYFSQLARADLERRAKETADAKQQNN